MDGLVLTVVLGVAVLAGTVLAPRVRIAPPLVLLIFGLALGFVPGLRQVELPSEAVLLLFLPVLLFWEALTTSLRSIRRDLRGIVLMSTVLVVATAFAVAGIAYALGMPWPAALMLGAALAPPDATAIASLGHVLRRRHFALLRAESLTNDGAALALYTIAVGFAVSGSTSIGEITSTVAIAYLGGVAAGLALGGLGIAFLRHTTDALTINITMLVLPFASYLAAEAFGASGVLSVVACGLLLSYFSARTSTALSRRQMHGMWPLGSYVLNGALFVLVGVQVQASIRAIDPAELGVLALLTVAVWLALMAVRYAFQLVAVLTVAMLGSRHRGGSAGHGHAHRGRVVSTVASFRGAVSLAIALSVPLTVAEGDPLAGRDEIVFVTAGVIVLTLLVQGPVLPALVRWARLPRDTEHAEELDIARARMSSVALDALDEISAELSLSDSVRERLSTQLRAVGQVAHASGSSGQDDDAPDHVDALAYARGRLALIALERDELHSLRRATTLDDEVVRRIEAVLDVEELRLSGVDPQQ